MLLHHSSIYPLYIYWKVSRLYEMYLDKNKWRAIQRNELMKLLKYAQQHSNYFNTIIKDNITIKNVNSIFKSIPLLDKEIIQREGENIFSNELNNKTRWANTGGSTGEPLRFPILHSCISWELLNQFILYKKMGYKFGDLIVAIDGSRISESNLKKNIYWVKGYNFPYGKYSYSTQYLNIDTVSYYINSLNKLKPSYLRGYPSGIKEFCLLANIKGKSIDFNLKGIYLTSENFSIEDKNFIGSFFNCPVYGQYGHTESSIFAIQEPSSDEYVCSPLYGITEILNDEGEQVKKGEQGEIVVTGFSHIGMPFIRYRTGDLAVYGGKNKFGEVILSNLLGRDVDFIYNKNDEKIYLVGFIFGGHIKAFNYIQSWQIIQNEKGKVILLIIKLKGFTIHIEKQIYDLFKNKEIDITIQYVDAIPKTKRGKRKFLIQNIK